MHYEFAKLLKINASLTIKEIIIFTIFAFTLKRRNLYQIGSD